MLLVALIFLLFWNIDLGAIVSAKNRAQTAGDTAALAAARWQGMTLNLIGELNIFHAAAVVDEDFATCEAITNLQARLCYVGPMTGFHAAQLAAKNNRIPSNDEFTEYIREHANTVRNTYTMDAGGGDMLFAEPFPGAWETYAHLLEVVAQEGIAAAPENAQFYMDRSGGHILLTIEFYEAIGGRNWCWFWFNNRDLLENYGGWRTWPPLPEADLTRVDPNDCEIFGLGVRPISRTFANAVNIDLYNTQVVNQGYDPVTLPLHSNLTERIETWYVYNTYRWQTWAAMDFASGESLPVYGELKPEYNYSGADAATRLYADVSRITPGLDGSTRDDQIAWSAAAKPFGYLDGEGTKEPPNSMGLVLPAFRSVRLIPVDASSAPSGGGFDLAWRRHCAEHLDKYVAEGPDGSRGGCWYCSQLRIWEQDNFREGGVGWLATNSWRCVLPSPGGGHGGGTRRGH